MLSPGPFYYPVVATARDMGALDWFEDSVCMGLLFAAGFVCVLRLLGGRLLVAPEKGWRSAVSARKRSNCL